LRIWITRRPDESVSGVSLSNYRPGQVYDVKTELGQYLVAKGYALIEMRKDEKAGQWPGPERRRRKVRQ
jgi:hypothetical protein